ncbi:MAG: type I-U CRISPR-associated protein Csx17 [Syntrophobacteraceae bacterium]
MNEHMLSGCCSTPLSSYLKSIAVLRLLSVQKDAKVKGCWKGNSFCILSSLTRDEIEAFFCTEYSPTPIVAPWNGGSGFSPGDSREGIEAILGSTDPRFALYRKVIETVKSWPEMPKPPERVGDITQTLSAAAGEMRPGKARNDIEQLLQGIASSAPSPEALGGAKPEAMLLKDVESLARKKGGVAQKALTSWWNAIKKARTRCTSLERGDNKDLLLSLCRVRLPEEALEWIDAAYALRSDGSASYNPILAIGGIDARLEFSNNFMQRVSELLLTAKTEQSKSHLRSALFGDVTVGLISGKIGQYDPGRAGGFNQGAEVETKDFKINPWDFVLMLEGTLLLAGALARRSLAEADTLASPFTVRFSSVGFTSSGTDSSRHETWLPLWQKPSSYQEVKHLFSEGRSTVGKKQARTGLDFSLAVGTLGVDRGIEAFERYAYLKRKGDNYIALPAGRLPVRYKPELELLEELDQVTFPLDRFLREFKNVPATFSTARRQIDEAAFACSKEPGPLLFADLVRALGKMERLLATRDRAKKPALSRPLLGLSPRWIMQCDDGSVEVRIAASIASIRGTGKVGPIRCNMSEVNPESPSRWAESNKQVAWFGSSLVERLSRVLARRMMDAERLSAPHIPLEAHLELSPCDLMPFLSGSTDDNKLEELLWGFTLIKRRKDEISEVRQVWRHPLEVSPISRTLALLKLLHSPHKIRDVLIRFESRAIQLLFAGRVLDACSVAIHRMKVSELKPFAVTYEEKLHPMRLLACLLVPVSEQRKMEALVLEKKTDRDSLEGAADV